MLFFLIPNIFSWSFNIPFTNYEINLFEDKPILYKFDSLKAQTNLEAEIEEKKDFEINNIPQTQLKEVKLNLRENEKEILNNFENETFEIQIKEESMKYLIQDSKIYETSSNDIDYLIKIKNETKLLQLNEKYLKGEELNIDELNKVIDIPLKLKIKVLMIIN